MFDPISHRITVCMPVFNESEGIEEFLRELNAELRNFDPSFVVIDDCSTDNTYQVLIGLVNDPSLSIQILRNDMNLGHGPTTLKALISASNCDSNIVVSIDGDGQFIGSNVRDFLKTFLFADAAIGEGVRVQRNDPAYRKISTYAARLLVFFRTFQFPRDANTPLRAYRRENLVQILNQLGSSCLTPNLIISAYVRKAGIGFCEIPVISIPRRGKNKMGSTWQTKRKNLPSKKWIAFCWNAIKEWFCGCR